MSKYHFYISKGVIQSVIAAFSFALMGAFVKLAGRELSSIQIVLFRNIVGLAFILSSLLNKPLNNSGGRFGLLMFRGFIGTLSLYTLYYNIGVIGLGESITYIQTSTIFVAVFSMIFLREYLTLWGWMAMFTGFLGIVLIFKPDVGDALLPNVLGVFNGIGAAAAYTSVRELKKHYDTRSIVLSFMAWGLILPVISIILSRWIQHPGLEFIISDFQWPQGWAWLWVFLVGITAMTGQIFVTKAYGLEKAGIVSTVGYINIPFAIILGILLGDAFPDWKSIAGIVLIILSGAVISIRRNI